MSIIYLLSGPNKDIGFSKEIKEMLKKDLKNKKSIAFIPTTPNDYSKTELYVYGNNNNIIGIIPLLQEISSLKDINIIDNRVSKEEAKKIILNSDVLYLLGGNPFNQLEYLQKENYDNLIKEFSGIIIGTSAGAMNLAKEAYYSKDEELKESMFYQTLGLVDITIDPHFDINNKEQMSEIIKNSNHKRIVGLPEESGIRIANKNISYINKCYRFENEKMTEIN